MKTIKNAFNAVINFLAKWFDKGITKVAEMTTPLVMSICGWSKDPITFKMVGEFAMGIVGYIAGLIAIAYLSVVFMTGLTLLLGLVLPILAANLIACGLTIGLIFLVGTRADTTRNKSQEAAPAAEVAAAQ